MSRDFKFRIWHKVDRRWLDPYLEEDPMINLNGEILIYERPPTSAWTNKDFVNKHLVAHQYTGHKDKNGKEIYEGDILKIRRQSQSFVDLWDDDFKCHLIYAEQYLGFMLLPFGSDFAQRADLYFDNGFDIEVIGNEFENPDLLT